MRGPHYEVLERKLASLVRELLEDAGIKVHVVESRTKTAGSFSEKISRPGKKYTNPMHELCDLVGIRAIVYYSDDVPKVEGVLRREFQIHETESIDKSAGYNPNEFGYPSVHHVISLKEPRLTLSEWKSFREAKCEIQIRTVLQHACAAISHALQYKREDDVPASLKRRLFRLAGMFEMVDEQFISIRDQHAELVSRVAREFATAKETISLDVVSVTQYIQTSPYLRDVGEFAEQSGFDVREGTEESYASDVVEECKRLKITTIGDLDRIIKKPGEKHKTFLKAALKNVGGGWCVDKGFFLYLLIIWAFVKDFTTEYLELRKWSPDIASAVLGAVKETVPTEHNNPSTSSG